MSAKTFSILGLFEIDRDLIPGYAFGLAILVVELVLASVLDWRDWTRLTLNYLCIFFGGSLGWIVGIILSPKSANEVSSFREYGKAISTFLSGYGIAKLDFVFEQIKQGHHPSMGDWCRGLFFGCTLLLGMLFVFVARQYPGHKEAEPKASDRPKSFVFYQE